MKQMLKLTGLLLATLLLLPSAHAEDIYKWVNSNGETQYTQMPPPHGIKAIRIQSVAPAAEREGDAASAEAPAAEAASGEEDAAGESADAGDDSGQDEVAETPDRSDVLARASRENCEKARRNLAALNRGNVRLRSADGQVIRLTEEERQQKITETNAQIELFCDN